MNRIVGKNNDNLVIIVIWSIFLRSLSYWHSFEVIYLLITVDFLVQIHIDVYIQVISPQTEWMKVERDGKRREKEEKQKK